jgi:hypothetical protein
MIFSRWARNAAQNILRRHVPGGTISTGTSIEPFAAVTARFCSLRADRAMGVRPSERAVDFSCLSSQPGTSVPQDP